MHLRLCLHAMDRTGPPMLALSFVEWMRVNHPEWTIDTVSFRGGPLMDRFIRIGPVVVLLDPDEAWDPHHPDPNRVRIVRRHTSPLGLPSVMLAVSVAAGQVLPYLPRPLPPLLTWSVEQGDDLHWIDEPVGLRESTTAWLAGSAGTAEELRTMLGTGNPPPVAPEFIADSVRSTDGIIDNVRTGLCRSESDLLIVGAGIATHRKGIDLFVETALAASRSGRDHHRFVWMGGEHDAGLHRVIAEVRRLGLDNVRFIGNVVDVTPWLSAADILLHTARLDAFPLVCLHAAAVGTPVVGFRHTSSLEAMFGDDAICADYPDTAGLLALIDHLGDRRTRREAGSRQQRRVVKNHTTSAVAATLFAHIESAARTRTGAVR